ncbi:alpha/beta hydrolase-fold protein [Prosthecobacter sp.]|uniref:alpha/beta hydrolase-fold protein n=1 Tax=Prosthecobacter sp. TaxID=1965333 RepID=UPI002AB941EB|nr:alpha/beta hydrolase-fold protein [Prosthecobacter sp.]MDZ4402626.1 alpha/beta hydrolase-fold protein [Prosthecobacter sp.]
MAPLRQIREQDRLQSLTPTETTPNVSHPPTPLVQITSQLDSVRRLSAALTAAGHVTHLNEYHGGHDSACWAAELPEALAWLMKG